MELPTDWKKVNVGLHQVYQYLPRHDTWVERAPLP